MVKGVALGVLQQDGDVREAAAMSVTSLVPWTFAGAIVHAAVRSSLVVFVASMRQALGPDRDRGGDEVTG